MQKYHFNLKIRPLKSDASNTNYINSVYYLHKSLNSKKGSEKMRKTLEKIVLFILRHGVGIALFIYAIACLIITCYLYNNPVTPQF